MSATYTVGALYSPKNTGIWWTRLCSTSRSDWLFCRKNCFWICFFNSCLVFSKKKSFLDFFVDRCSNRLRWIQFLSSVLCFRSKKNSATKGSGLILEGPSQRTCVSRQPGRKCIHSSAARYLLKKSARFCLPVINSAWLVSGESARRNFERDVFRAEYFTKWQKRELSAGCRLPVYCTQLWLRGGELGSGCVAPSERSR